MNSADDDIFMTLVLKYLDGDGETLNGDEREELNRMLRTDAARRRQLAVFCTHAWLLRETYLPEHVAPAPKRRKPRRRLAVATIVVVLAACVGLAVLNSRRRGDVLLQTIEGPVIASLGAVSGSAWIAAPGGEARDAQTGGEIRSGDDVRLDGQGATAELNYPDGTRLLLLGRTSVTLQNDPAKSVALHAGTLSAVVTPQPAGNPMTLTTPAARLRVVGTEFSVSADDARTDLRVREGRVTMTRNVDGNSVEVSGGKSAVAQAQIPLVARDISSPADTWELNAEDGLPAGMTRGRWTGQGLPRGSRGGVAAVQARPGNDGLYFEIGTTESWQDGLFAVHPDSHFHCTFKMARPGWLNFFVICRRFETSGPHSINYLFDELEFRRLQPNQWRTVTIPFSRFKRLANVPGEPFANQVPYMILLSAQEPDRGLVIDRMWVTRGGPGKVTYSDVE
jgi:ferric-dicitrate binding protein FerR (iron transport regulator)